MSIADQCFLCAMLTLHHLLDQQYDSCETYCNSLTALYNCIQEKQRGPGYDSSNILSIIQQYQAALRKVDHCMQSLRDQVAANEQAISSADEKSLREVRQEERRLELLQEHLDRSQRILKSINRGISFHANGLPKVATGQENNIVVLATLRASIRQLQKRISAQ